MYFGLDVSWVLCFISFNSCFHSEADTIIPLQMREFETRRRKSQCGSAAHASSSRHLALHLETVTDLHHATMFSQMCLFSISLSSSFGRSSGLRILTRGSVIRFSWESLLIIIKRVTWLVQSDFQWPWRDISTPLHSNDASHNTLFSFIGIARYYHSKWIK